MSVLLMIPKVEEGGGEEGKRENNRVRRVYSLCMIPVSCIYNRRAAVTCK